MIKNIGFAIAGLIVMFYTLYKYYPTTNLGIFFVVLGGALTFIIAIITIEPNKRNIIKKKGKIK